MLTDSQVNEYNGEGYTVARQLFRPDEIAVFVAEADRVSEGSTLAHHDRTRIEMEPDQLPGGTVLRRIYEPCSYYAPYRELSESDKLLNCVEQLLGPDLEFHYSKINMKPPSIGSVVDWHQDLSYYPLTNPDSVSILIYLDDADRQNGCLQVIPRRHRVAPMDHTHGGLFQGRVTESMEDAEKAAVPLEAPAGSVIFMHCLTPHASVANTSDRARKTLILSYRASDAYPVYAGEGTVAAETHVRLVRGVKRLTARFGFSEFPIPRQGKRSRSLYELQEMSRKGQVA
jgi:ectoine hydroxylase-related dioxygenase (phytanoyl-CoA dioxygenase family)